MTQNGDNGGVSEAMKLELDDLKLENRALLMEQNMLKKHNNTLENELN